MEDTTKHIILDTGEDPLKNMYDALGGEFEEKLLRVALNFINQELNSLVDYSKRVADTLEFQLPDQSSITSDYHTSETYSTIISVSTEEIKKWKEAYRQDSHLSQVLKAEGEENIDKYTQYQIIANGFMYFEDWKGNHRLVVPESLQVEIMGEVHNTITEAVHGGYTKCYCTTGSLLFYCWPQMSRDIKKYIGIVIFVKRPSQEDMLLSGCSSLFLFPLSCSKW